MNEGKKWFRLLVACLFAATLALAGCSGDDGSMGPAGLDGAPGAPGADGAPGAPGADGADGANGQDFQLPEAEMAGLLACSTCHGSGTAAKEWVESKHAMNSSHSLQSCAAACHNPSGAMFDMDAAFGVSPTGTAVGCEDCHGPGSNHVNLPNQVQIANTAPAASVCGQCHNAEGELAHLSHHPFNEQIYTRYANSGHGNSGHGGGFCSACHSHQGGVANINSGRKTSVRELFEKFTPDTVASWTMEEETGLLDMQCNTCHDPHKTSLRTSDTIEAVTYDDDDDAATPDVTEEVVVYSAEFNLCTSCHMVALDYEVAGHGDAGALLSYSLSADSYSAANILDAETATFSEDVLEPFYNADLTIRTSPRVVYNTQVFYHDNTAGGGRNFSDTHFAGTVIGAIAGIRYGEEGHMEDQVIKGYNINAANPDACTVCHDPHSANKVQGEGGVAQAASFAEGVGEFHTDYLGDALGHGCQPCHAGNEGFNAWLQGGSMPTDRTTDVIACRTCHELEQADPTAVRAFPEGYEFAFASGAVVDVADLGVNQICFECHKGRTPALTAAQEAALPAGVTQWRKFAYLHYAPVFATLFGSESQMLPTYPGKTYAGKFTHYNGVEFGCVDCHNVHDTNGNDAALSKMQNPDFQCNGCHSVGAALDAAVLKGRSVAFGQRLLDTIIAAMAAEGVVITEEDLMASIADRNGTAPTVAIAKAGQVWKIFNYEEGSPHGLTHGHGGSWAHNSKIARQLQYDAIESLGGDLTGLTRP